MRFLLFLAVSALLFSSCTRDNDIMVDKLDGRWKLITVIDNASGIPQTKPVNAPPADVELEFSFTNPTAGTTRGKTQTNLIGGSFSTVEGTHSISVSQFLSTKISETSWGKLFMANISEAEEYQFGAPAKLRIRTKAKVLVFTKI